MANFAKNLQDASDDELMLWVNTLNPNYVTLASDELSRREMKRLKDTMEKVTGQTEKLNTSTTRFSKVLIALALIQMVIAWSQLTLIAQESEKWFPLFVMAGTAVFGYAVLNHLSPIK